MTATDQVVGLIPVVIAADVALRVTDRALGEPRQKKRRKPRGIQSLSKTLQSKEYQRLRL